MDTLFETKDADGYTIIDPHIRFDSDKITFRFYLEDEKYSKIELSPNSREIIGYLIGNRESFSDTIEALASRYHVTWDKYTHLLFIRFRRNEMALSQAVMRLTQATQAIISLNRIIKD